jgi:tetratricopeptide (TPR) repeat protein
MRDDVTPTDPQPIDVLHAQLEALRKDPSDGELYYELRTDLRDSGQAEKLAEVSELRAPHEADPHKAATIWSEAGEARLVLGHDEQGEHDLRAALALDPANERAASRLAERCMVAGAFAEAAAILEAELADLAARAADAHPATARRGHRHRMLAQLWDERLGRVDRALYHWQQAWRLEPDRSEAIEAARAIYASLGDDEMVAQLYQAELDALAPNAPAKRRASLELALGKLCARQGDPITAAEHLVRAADFDPASTEAREALADVYATPAFAGAGDEKRRASELFVALGRERMRTQDKGAAIGYLRRALGVDPYSRAGTENLEEALLADERWPELERFYRHQESLAETPEDRARLLARRALLYDDRIDDREALKQCQQELLAYQPALGDAARRLRKLYREDQEWKALASLIERDTEALAADPGAQRNLVGELLELATLTREHLGDRDRAAEHLHRVLTIDSHHQEALARYHDHFRERRDWRGLADLTEFTIDSAREAGAPPGEIVRQLEELAQLAELRLGDVDRAVTAWRRVQEIEPDHAKAREALRRLASRAKMWESLVGVLEQEAQAARGPHERAEALRRIAQVYRERQVSPRRAIALYEDVVTTFPDDDASLKALTELYEREGDDAGLARTLRRQLDADARRIAGSGQRVPTARDWPVAKRVERLTTLRRLAAMYEQRLADVDGVVFSCTAILEILPGDRDALDRLERVLDQAGDFARLEQTLEYHAEAATGPAEKAKVMRRLARLARDRHDDVAALDRWERLLKAAPGDAEALGAAATLYERAGRWPDLAAVLERALAGRKLPAPGTPESAERSIDLRRYALVVDGRLGDAARATRAWRQVLEVLPRDREALDALARLHEARGEWRELAEVLERQAPLYVDDEPAKAAELALRRARLLEERLGAPAEAARARAAAGRGRSGQPARPQGAAPPVRGARRLRGCCADRRARDVSCPQRGREDRARARDRPALPRLAVGANASAAGLRARARDRRRPR